MGLSFLRGLVAAVNPCAFVLLPTYLLYFLGVEGHLPGSHRASVRRALLVSSAVSAGFMAVFVSVGMVSEYVTDWVRDQAAYATPVIGVAFVVLGVAMFFGYNLPFATPKLATGRPDHTVSAMFVYGVAYAVASIGCTLPLFMTTLFGNVRGDGWASGVLNVAAYGVGMALVVTALTIALAVANTSLLGALRRGSRHIDRIAASLVVASGLYLVYYFWVVELRDGDSSVIDRVDRFQQRVVTQLNDHWPVVAVALTAVVLAAIVYVFGRRRLDEPAQR